MSSRRRVKVWFRVRIYGSAQGAGAGWCRRLVWCSPRRWCWWRRRFRLHPCLLLIDWGAESRSESWCVRWVHLVFSPWSAPVTPAERLPRGTCSLCLSLSLPNCCLRSLFLRRLLVCSFFWWVQSFFASRFSISLYITLNTLGLSLSTAQWQFVAMPYVVNY